LKFFEDELLLFWRIEISGQITEHNVAIHKLIQTFESFIQRLSIWVFHVSLLSKWTPRYLIIFLRLIKLWVMV